MPTLFGSPLSPFVCKAAVMLEEKGVAYEWKFVRPHDRDPEFQAISPLGKIPAYKDDKVSLSDSSVICHYLERTYPAPALYPAPTAEFVRALWWEEYFDDGLIVPMRNIVFHQWMNPLFGRPVDEKLLNEGREKLPAMLDFVESKLQPNAWMVGNDFSIADISLGVGFVNLAWVPYVLDEKRWPKLTAYITRIHQRPSFKKSIAAGNDFIKQAKEKTK